MNIALTGANGFIGGHLKKTLQDQGHSVISIPHRLLDEPGAVAYRLRDGVDYIYHVGAYGNYHHQTDGYEMINSNVLRTWNLLEATKDIQYSGFIYVSSSSVYGRKTKPMDENDPIDPETLYGATKASAEFVVKAFGRVNGKPTVIARPFTVYGPGDNPKHLIPTVIRAIREDKEVTLDPLPVHDYIYIDDVIDGLIEIKDQGVKYPGTIINLGGGMQYTNAEVVAQIQQLMGKKARIRISTQSLRDYDTRYWLADTTLARFSGVVSQYTLEEGLACTLKT